MNRKQEDGYTLFALLAAMTVIAIMLAAAAPSLRQQSRRERELEAIRRGEEVAEAIRRFAINAQRPPTSMKELLEGVNRPGRTKKLQVLRASAARDPLTEDGEWRLIRTSTTNAALCDFAAALTKLNGGVPVQPNQIPGLPQVQCSVSGLPGGASTIIDDADGGTGPFIGVASRSRETAVVTYYGIEQHNEWVFTPLFPKDTN